MFFEWPIFTAFYTEQKQKNQSDDFCNYLGWGCCVGLTKDGW